MRLMHVPPYFLYLTRINQYGLLYLTRINQYAIRVTRINQYGLGKENKVGHA